MAFTMDLGSFTLRARGFMGMRSERPRLVTSGGEHVGGQGQRARGADVLAAAALHAAARVVVDAEGLGRSPRP